jgi:hypothetical protein
MGTVFSACLQLELGFARLPTVGAVTATVRGQLQDILVDRWTFLHSPLHSVGFLLDPANHRIAAAVRQLATAPSPTPEAAVARLSEQRAVELHCSLVDDFQEVAMRMLGKEKAAAAVNELSELFSPVECQFTALAIQQRGIVPGWRWWDSYGMRLPTLRSIAVRVLACVSSSSACERNWSDYGFIHSKKRNKLSAEKSEQLVYVYSNSRLLQRGGDSHAGRVQFPWLKDGGASSSEEGSSDGEGSDCDPIGNEGGGTSSGSSSSSSCDDGNGGDNSD